MPAESMPELSVEKAKPESKPRIWPTLLWHPAVIILLGTLPLWGPLLFIFMFITAFFVVPAAITMSLILFLHNTSTFFSHVHGCSHQHPYRS